MASVRPFRAYRYASETVDITPLTAPPYDVINDSQRAALIGKDSHNVVELELPLGSLDPTVEGNRYSTGRATWDAWKAAGVVTQDVSPSIYVLEQRFVEGNRSYSRRAFISEVGLHAFSEKVILPHERTLPKALGDRFQLIKATGANFSQVFGLFSDATNETDSILRDAMANAPVATSTDDDGVVSTLWAVSDASALEHISTLLSDKQIFIADGHHRYTTSLAYRDLRREETYGVPAAEAPMHPEFDETADSEFVMMALVNMEDPQLLVLPYHRMAKAPLDLQSGESTFDANDFIKSLKSHFDVVVGTQADLDASAQQAFLLSIRGKDETLLVTLREDIDPTDAIDVPHTNAWKQLDVAILQELILNPLLDIHPDRPETLERISFSKDSNFVLGSTSDNDVAFILRPTRMDQLRAVSLSGETMPQKSTYFYPKLASGLLFRTIEN